MGRDATPAPAMQVPAPVLAASRDLPYGIAMSDAPAPGTGSIIEESVITCPHCGTQKRERMPTDACQFFYVCSGCGARLKPKPGDCCVFCSYGTVPCPPIQEARAGGGPARCC
jgi:hypothetical protein